MRSINFKSKLCLFKLLTYGVMAAQRSLKSLGEGSSPSTSSIPVIETQPSGRILYDAEAVICTDLAKKHFEFLERISKDGRHFRISDEARS